MSSAVCLSLVANLRCSGLRPLEAIAILVPAAVEAALISCLIYTQWNKGRKHFLLIFESYMFLILCVVDFVSKASDAISTSVAVFSVVDRVLGGLSGFPIVLYTLFLYLFARRHFISILPTHLQWSVKILLTLLIPVILVLVELGSLLGISYTTLSGSPSELAMRFKNPLSKTLWTLLNSAGLVLLVLYQCVCFCLAIFRVFRYFTQANTSDSPRTDSKGSRNNTTRMRGIGWIAAGIKLGAIEVLLGFVPNGFGMALSRRLFRIMGRLTLAWGVYQGIDEGPGSLMFRVGSIDSIEGLPPRRIPVNPSGLRTLIGAPMTETFAKMSPTATAFHTRKKVPDAMSGLRNFDASFMDEKVNRTVNVGPALTVQNVLAPSGAPYGFGRASYIGKESAYPERLTFPKLRQNGKRVTLAYDGLQAPVLDIRFSTQVLSEAGKLINRIGKHSPTPSTDHSPSEEAGTQRPPLSRPRSSPAATIGPRPMFPSRLGHMTEEQLELSQIGVAIATETSAVTVSTAPELLPMSRTANGGRRGRSRSTSHKSAQATLYNPFADPPNPNQSFSGSQETPFKRNLMKRADSSLSEDSLTAIRQISSQFPPLPSGIPATDFTGRSGRATQPPQRSSSSPRLRSSGANGMVGVDEQMPSPRRINTQDLSPRASLDQDIATRTRRRIQSHLKNTSPSSSVGVLAEAQWAGNQGVSSVHGQIDQSAGSSPNRNTLISAANSLFSTRGGGVHTKSASGDMLTSPITVFSTDSVFSADGMLSPPPPVDRPVGRLARRVLGIEQFLGEEKEKWEASQDGHGEQKSSNGSVQPSSTSNIHFNFPLSRERGAPSSSRVRPRSNVDNIALAPRPPKRSMTVDDPDARKAFAAAWRTVVPTVGSPSVTDLKNVNSVRVKKTPAPSRHRAVFSGESLQSMRVDEMQFGPLSPVAAAARRSSQRGVIGSRASSSKDPAGCDREFVRKARSMKAASVDSEVY